MTPLCLVLWLTVLCVKVVLGEETGGQRIVKQFGDDVNFATKQITRGLTSLFGPVLDVLVPEYSGEEGDLQNLLRVILRDGVNALGKGVKAGGTIASAPARVAGTFLEEAIKATLAVSGNADVEGHVNGTDSTTGGGAKLISTLLNTTSSELSQANVGAVLLENALKNRIKYIGNKTTSYVVSSRPDPPQHPENKPNNDGVSITIREDEATTKSLLDDLIEIFNEAVNKHDERLWNGLKVLVAAINPPEV